MCIRDRLVAALPDHAGDVGDPHVLPREAELLQQAEAGQGRRARAGYDELHLGNILADQRQRVEQCGADDDGGAVLVLSLIHI